MGNALLLLLISTFVLTNRSASQTVRTSTLNSVSGTANSSVNPLDQLSSAQIALTIAQTTHVAELTDVRNQADSDSLTLNVVPSDNVALAKPQIVATSLKSKQDIVHYTTVAGDSLSSLADKFAVTANSIKWSNNLSSSNIAVGTSLVIPPVNGIVYTVKSGDTPSSLASRYQADANQIISYNDAEITGLKPGDQIIVPNGSVPTPVYSYVSYASSSGFAFGSSAIYGYNGYGYGSCTWYVATQIAVPTNWGNANTWARGARAAGWTVSPTPSVGAIAQTAAMSYLGHVAIVDEVSPDGTMIKYRDMNGIAGYDRVGYSDWVSAGTFQNYITP